MTTRYEVSAWMNDSDTNPVPTTASPVVTTALVPTRSTIRADSGAVIIITVAKGSIRTPACSGVYPCTNCQYCVNKNIEPNRAKNVSVMALLAAGKRAFLKNVMSSIGVGVCSSHTMNEPSRTTPATNATITLGAV